VPAREPQGSPRAKTPRLLTTLRLRKYPLRLPLPVPCTLTLGRREFALTPLHQPETVHRKLSYAIYPMFYGVLCLDLDWSRIE